MTPSQDYKEALKLAKRIESHAPGGISTFGENDDCTLNERRLAQALISLHAEIKEMALNLAGAKAELHTAKDENYQNVYEFEAKRTSQLQSQLARANIGNQTREHVVSRIAPLMCSPATRRMRGRRNEIYLRSS